MISCADAVDVLVAHALRRLVEQHQLRVHRQRGRDLERALAAVGQLDRRRAGVASQVDRAQQLERARRSARRASAPGFQKWNEVPSLRCSATRTFSSTVRCGNTAEIWNERMMPRRAMCAGVSGVMSCAVEQDLARRSACRNLVSRLKQVVLPAPLGPISAWMRAAPHLQVDLVDRDEALELLGQLARLEDDVVAGVTRGSCPLAARDRCARRQARAAEPLRRRSARAATSTRVAAAAVAPSMRLVDADPDAGDGVAGGVEHRRADAVHALAHALVVDAVAALARTSASSSAAPRRRAGPCRVMRAPAGRPETGGAARLVAPAAPASPCRCREPGTPAAACRR